MGKHDLGYSGSESNENDSDSENAYLVEVITKVRVAEAGDFEYRVKWYEYTSDEDTWEPGKNVAECHRLLKSFWKEVGKHNKKRPGPRGTVYAASDDWIKNERKHFRREMQAEKAAKLEKQKERERSSKTKATRIAVEDDAPTKSRSVKKSDALSLFSDVRSESESDAIPLSIQLKKKGKERETTRTAQGIAKAAISIKKSSAPVKLPIQTSSTQPNKYLGMKISRKASGTAYPSPLNPPTIPSADTISSRLKASFPTAHPTMTSTALKEPSTRDAGPSKQFLPPRPRTVAPATCAPPASSEDVDNFLATMMSFEQSEAQRPENLASAPTKTSTVVPPNLKFLKKWSWSGELFFDTSDAAEKLCDITIHDTSETSEIGFRLSQALDSRDSLRLSKSYRRSELNVFLQALKKVDQIAKISHREERDKDPLSVFMKYLYGRRLIISSAFITSSGHVAEMVVFPSTDKDLCKRLNLPLRYQAASCLLLALMPWHIPPSKYNALFLRSDELKGLEIEAEIEEIRNEYPHIVSKPDIETAFRILGFDTSFIKFLPSRKYCVWSLLVDSKPTERGRKFSEVHPETKALFDVLSFLKAENVGYDNAGARVVFVHVGSIRSIRNLPGIVQRRCDTPEVRFVTYGAHESVKPSLWGFKEIYPLGGIVTFTATALLENPLRVAELIEQIDRHPHWECYILPSVLAVFVRLSCPGEDPLSVYAREPYHFARIFNLIEDGKIALMQSPDLDKKSPSVEEGKRDKWIAAQYATLVKTPVQLLEECWSSFVSEYSNKTETELRDSIEIEIVEDLTRLQTQQTIRESYRRFVVIRAVQDSHINLQRDGFEWRTAQEFSFGDTFPTHNDDVAGESQEGEGENMSPLTSI